MPPAPPVLSLPYGKRRPLSSATRANCESLAARGIAAPSINPKQVDRFRDRCTANGAMKDRSEGGEHIRNLDVVTRIREIQFERVMQLARLESHVENATPEPMSLATRRTARCLRSSFDRTYTPCSIQQVGYATRR